jgi:hypothetical protein
VGTTDQGSLVRSWKRGGSAKGGVVLSVLGFGTGNTKDSTIGDAGRQAQRHLRPTFDTLNEARKVLVHE